MKKLISSLLSVLILCSVFTGAGITATAADTLAERAFDADVDYKYTLLENGTVEITKYTGSDTVINIPSIIDEYIVESIGTKAFSGSSITSITIPDSVISIRDRAFINCEYLEDVTLGNNIKTIGDKAFFCLFSLEKIVLPDSLISIGESAFQETSICELKVGKNIEHIGWNAFNSCFIKNITIPGSIKDMPGAFSNCTLLETVIIEEGATSISSTAFMGCTKLNNITIPDSITYIGSKSFDGCKNLSNIKLPINLKIIDAYAFNRCPLANINIPDTVTNIGKCAFKNTLLTSVKLPQSVKSIGLSSFDSFALSEISIKNPACKIPENGYIDYEGGTWASAIPSTTTVLGYINSTAQTYADNNNLTFIILYDIVGDINFDGYINVRDITLLQKICVGLVIINKPQELNSDLNYDGTINVNDVTTLQKYCVGMIDLF